MMEMQAAMIEAHEKNLHRYARLLATGLSELERQFIHRRIAEERLAIERLSTDETVVPPTAPSGQRDPATPELVPY